MTTAVPSLMKFEGWSALEADRAPVRPPRITSLARDDNMTTNPKFEAALALHRFGFGPVAGSIAAITGSARSKRGQSPHRSRSRRGHRFRRAPCLVLVESLLCFGRQDPFDGRCL